MSGSHPRGAAIARVAVALLVVASVVAGSTAALAADGGASTARDSLADGASPAATALAAGGTGGDETVENASEGDGSAVDSEDRPGGRQRIPDSLRAAFDRDRDGVTSASATDTVEVVVRFREARAAAPAQANSAAGLQDHASVTQAPFRAFVRRTQGIERRQDFWIANAMLVEVDPERVSLERLVDVPHVTRVHRNFEVELADAARSATADGSSGSTAAPTATDSTTATSADATAATSTTATDTTYGLDMVNASSAWNHLDTRGDGVDVAILDTGADPDHPDVDVDGWAEFDESGDIVTEGREHAYDSGYHGTHVAGTVVGGDDSGTHIGVAPDARHHHGLVLPGGGGTYAQVIGGIEWATNDVEADVVSMSLGASDTYMWPYIDPIQNARGAGTLVVASSGNDGESISSSPGNVYDAVSVGAVDDQRDVASFSSGETIDTDAAWGSSAPADWPDSYTVPQVSAPGVGVWSAYPESKGGGYVKSRGTSMAAPHVAGAAALLFAGDPGITVAEAERRLTETAIHPAGEDAHDHRYGHGVIDAYRAAQDGSISGVVRGIDDAPIANATVNLSGAATATATTDADGAFAFEGLSPCENYTVAAAADRYHPANASLALSTGESVTQNVSIDPKPGAIEGNVTDADTDNGVANASVTLWDAASEQVETDETGPNGSYAFETVHAGDNYTVTAGGDRYEASERRNVSVAPNGTTTVDLETTPRPGTVAGTVLDDVSAGAIANATVSLENASDVEIDLRETDENGTYSFANVSRAADYELSVVAPNYDGWNASFDVGPNETVERTPALDPHEGSLQGRVTSNVTVNGTDDAIANASVEVADGDDTVALANTTENGSFAIDPLPRAENYTVSVEHDRYEPASVTVTVGPGEAVEQNVSATPSPGTIAGDVTDREGVPLANATVGLDTAASVEPAETDANGSYELTGVPAVREQVLNVSARAYRHNASVTATLVANGSATRAVTLVQRDHYVGVEPLDAPATAETGDAVAVAATVSNLGTDDWTDQVDFRVDGEVVANETVSLNASNATEVAFETVVDDAGETEFAVVTSNESATATVAVEAPSSGGGGLPAPPAAADVSVVDRQLSTSTVAPGEPVEVVTTLRNDGDADGSQELSLTADGAVLATASVAVPAGSTVETTLVGTVEAPGTYDLVVDGASAGVVTVTDGGADDAGVADATANDSVDDAANESGATNGSAGDGQQTESAPSDGSPGFGVATGLVAVLVAALLTRRRRVRCGRRDE